jgi:hypothetical protein
MRSSPGHLRELSARGLVEATDIAASRRQALDERVLPHVVLVVDGDVGVRTFLVRALHDRGIAAAGTTDPDFIDGRPPLGEPWCLVICDVASAPPSHGRARGEAAMLLVTSDPVGADLVGDDPSRPVLKPLFVRDWLQLIERRCRRHRRTGADNQEAS